MLAVSPCCLSRNCLAYFKNKISVFISMNLKCIIGILRSVEENTIVTPEFNPHNVFCGNPMDRSHTKKHFLLSFYYDFFTFAFFFLYYAYSSKVIGH